MNAIFILPDPRTNGARRLAAKRLRIWARVERLHRRDPGVPVSREARASGPDGPADDDDARVVGGVSLADVRPPVADERLEDRLGRPSPEPDALEDLARPRVAVGVVEAVEPLVESVGGEDEARGARQLELRLLVDADRAFPERE